MKPDAPVTRMRVTICPAQSASSKPPTRRAAAERNHCAERPGPQHARDCKRDQRHVDDKDVGDDLGTLKPRSVASW